MKEFSMFYKIRNILLILLSFVLTHVEAKAQGVVSLSEEAMFEDELDTELSKPEENKSTNAEVPVVTNDEIGAKPIEPALAEKKDDEKLPELEVPSSKDTAEEGEANPFEGNLSDEVNMTESTDSDLYKTLDGKTNLKSENVFEHMSDIEKRTAILNLELRREKLQDEIEAVKYKRREALAKEKQKEEDQRLKNLAAEKEIERKLVEEQANLRELDLKFEKLRQEKVLGAYKNKMLQETQKWIEHDGAFYKQINDLRESQKVMAEDMKKKMSEIKDKTALARQEFVKKVTDYEKRIEDKDSQIAILRTRVTNLERERDESKKNPFAGFDKEQLAAAAGIDISVLDAVTKAQSMQNGSMSITGDEPIETDLTKMYGVTEIRGKGDELIAKLINHTGTSFYVKKGTILQSGHVVAKITTTYVMAEKNGDKQYLYFSAGGILPTEVSGLDISKVGKSEETAE